ncbi:hypothetical protein [Scytonema hofmannii]|nr:hypothetical protein [Scytonema hofmannii]
MMIVTVRDPGILSNLDPQQLTTYLQANGWNQERQIGNSESVWYKTTDSGEEFDITLPLNPTIRSYALRMSEILETLEKASGHSQLDILSDLITQLLNTQVQGIVIQLEEGNYGGNITIMGFVVGKLRQIHIRLSESERSLAIKAYQERLPVACTGDLIKDGSYFVLKNQHDFTVIKG